MLAPRPVFRSALATLAVCALPIAAAAQTLELIQSVPGLGGTSTLALPPGEAQVYAADGDSGLLTFTRDPLGTLVLTEAQPKGVCVEGSVGALCSNSSDCDVTPPDGLCFEMLERATDALVTPDGACLYVANGSKDAIAVYTRDPGTGAVTFDRVLRHRHCYAGTVDATCTADAACDTSPGAGDGRCLTDLEHPRRLVVSPDGVHLYGALNFTGSIVVLERTAPSCALEVVQTLTDGVGGVDGLHQVRNIAIDAAGTNVYTTSSIDNSLAVFARDVPTGTLTQTQALLASVCTAGLVGGRCQADHWCDTVFEAGDGECTVSIPAVLIATDVAVSPDDAHVYVSNHHGIAVFARDGMTGAVTQLDDGFLAPEGKFGESLQMTFTPDGATLIAQNGIALQANVVYEREAATGALAPYQLTTTGGLDQVVTSDGGFLYTANGTPMSFAIRPPFTCSPTPAAGCRLPVKAGKGQLKVHDDERADKDALTWKLGGGAATVLADYGDPTRNTSHAVCVYDGSGAAQPRVALRLPEGGFCDKKLCWSAKGKFQFKSKPSRLPDGITSALLDDGADGKAKIQVKAVAERMGLGPLGFTTPVVVQLHSESGICWENRFGTAKKNTVEDFSAKSD